MFTHKYHEPKSGKVFKVVGVARISTDNQDEKSLDDQEAYYRQWLNREYGEGNYVLKVIAYRGSGQILDNEEFLQLCEMVASGDYDLVIAEDLSRIIRRIHGVIFCEEAEDTATRVVGIGDPLDTSKEGWETNAVFSSLKNSAFCKDTSRRIKRSHRNRFDNGGIFQHEIWGHDKPDGKSHESDVTKLPKADRIYDKWFTMLEGDENGEGVYNYREVADWLNDEGIPTGKLCKLEKWDGPMVRRYTFNTLLKGERRRNDRVTIRVNKTGRPKTVPAPEEHRLVRQCPHLAFIEPERYDRVIRILKKRNAKYKRAESVVNDPRAGIPKRQTRWPGQHLRCGVCGRLYVFGGHGRKERLMCNGAREHKCWNAMTVSGPEVAVAVGKHLRELVRDLPNFDEMWVQEFNTQRDAQSVKQNSELTKYSKLLEAENRKLENLITGLAAIGSSDAMVCKIREAEDRVNELRDKISESKSRKQGCFVLPTLEEIQSVADVAFADIAVESIEFSRLMRELLDDFFVLPYRLADGGAVQPRVVFQVSMGRLLNSKLDLPITQFGCEVDLMKQPKRLRYLNDVVRLESEGMKHKDIAEQLGIFKSEVGYAMKLHRLISKLGTDDPWIPMRSSAQVYESFKRVRNPRFKFEPLPGFEITRHPTA